MTSSASTDTFPDVAETRRASGITIAPEAALHRALQERTDELERVRVELSKAWADRDRWREAAAEAERKRSVEEAKRWLVEPEVDTLRRERDEARAERDAARGRFDAMEAEVEAHRLAKASAVEAVDRCEATHGAVEAALQELAENLKHERDTARAEIAAALREIPIEQHRHHAGKPPIVLHDEVAHIVREWARRDHEMDRVWDACETVLTSDEVDAIVKAQPDDVEMGAEVLVLAALAKLRREHSEGLGSACAGGCMLTRRWKPSVPMLDDDSTLSITATDPEDAARRVSEYVSAHAPPTAPDVGSTTSAPAAGAADPLCSSTEHEVATLRRERDEARAELRQIKRSAEIQTWSVHVFGA